MQIQTGKSISLYVDLKKLMHVAVNTRLMQHGPLDGIGRFSFEILRRVADDNPNDRFTLLFDRRFHPRYLTSPNMRGKVLFPPTRLPFLMDIFFEASLPIALKNLRPNVFFSPDGWVSLTAKTPTVSVVHDLNFIHMPEHLPPRWRKYYLKKFPLFIRRADHIVTVSEFSKRDLMERLDVPAEKISVVYNDTAEGFRPAVDESELQRIRQKYAQGKPYFLFVGLIHPRKNIRGLMEAFALLKKQTGSEAKLLVAGAKKWWTAELEKQYRENTAASDIHFLGRLDDEDLQEVYRGALALVFPSFFEGFGIPLLEAFKSGIPAITSHNTALTEVGGDAVLYGDPNRPETFAQAMGQVLDDAALRTTCIQKGFAQAQKFSWDAGAQTVSQILHRYA